MAALTTEKSSSQSSSSFSSSSSSHPDYSLSRLHSHAPSAASTSSSSKSARPLSRSFFSSSSSSSKNSAKGASSSAAHSGPRPSTSSSTASSSFSPPAQSAARPISRRLTSSVRSFSSTSVQNTDPNSYRAVFSRKTTPGGLNLAANLAFGGTQKPQSANTVTVSRAHKPKTVDVSHRRNNSIESNYSSVSSSDSEFSFLPVSPTGGNSSAVLTLKPFAKANRSSIDARRSIEVPQPILEVPERGATPPPIVPKRLVIPPVNSQFHDIAEYSPVSASSPEQFEPRFGRFSFDFNQIESNRESRTTTPEEETDSPFEKPPVEKTDSDAMGLVRNFTIRSSSKREAGAPPPQRPQISLPVNLISTTNVASFRAPDIVDAQKSQDSPTSTTSFGHSAHSSVHETDTSATTEPNLTDASSAASSLSSSPIEPKGLANYFSRLNSKEQEPEPTRIVDTTEPISTDENQILPPAIPKRAPSHSKREHFRLSRMRSMRQSGSETRDFADQPVEYNADDDDSSPDTSPRSRQHPFSLELEQLEEVAEEFSASATAAMDEEDEEVMEKQGLVAFSVDDYLNEIRADDGFFYPDSPAVLRQASEAWI